MPEYGNALFRRGAIGDGPMLREQVRPVLQVNFEITRDSVPALAGVEEWTLMEAPPTQAIDWQTKEPIEGEYEFGFAWYVEVPGA